MLGEQAPTSSVSVPVDEQVADGVAVAVELGREFACRDVGADDVGSVADGPPAVVHRRSWSILRFCGIKPWA